MKTALEWVQGDIAIIQDTDLEYEPREYPHLPQVRPPKIGEELPGRDDPVYRLEPASWS